LAPHLLPPLNIASRPARGQAQRQERAPCACTLQLQVPFQRTA